MIDLVYATDLFDAATVRRIWDTIGRYWLQS